MSNEIKMLQYQICYKHQLSKEAKEILSHGIGHVDTTMFGVSASDAEYSYDHVINYLIYDLDNIEALDWSLMTYGLPGCEEYGFDFGEKAMYEFCKFYLKSENIYVYKFHTSKTAVAYCDITDHTEFYPFFISGRSIIISDQGPEGVYIAFSKPLSKNDKASVYMTNICHKAVCINRDCKYQSMCCRSGRWDENKDLDKKIDYPSMEYSDLQDEPFISICRGFIGKYIFGGNMDG